MQGVMKRCFMLSFISLNSSEPTTMWNNVSLNRSFSERNALEIFHVMTSLVSGANLLIVISIRNEVLIFIVLYEIHFFHRRCYDVAV